MPSILLMSCSTIGLWPRSSQKICSWAPTRNRCRRCSQNAESVISQRAQHFAEEGWSVVQIVAAQSGWREQVYNSVERLNALRKSGEAQIRIVPKAPTPGQPHSAVCLRSLSAAIKGFSKSDTLILIFGPLTDRGPASSQTFTANGLAG